MPTRQEITYSVTTKSFQDIINLHEDGHLNLTPSFQRESVWGNRDRMKLIDSIIHGYPLPAIFLYRREENGDVIYDVLDGKQRIETVLMFMGLLRGNRFTAKIQLPNTTEADYYNWKKLIRLKKQSLITGYNIPVIGVDGDFSDMVELFVRINSTGKALSTAEKRKAKYFNSPLLKEAFYLSSRYEEFFLSNGILSEGQINRMKHMELILELMISIYQGSPLNKKATLDRVMDSSSFNRREIKKTKVRTILALNRIKRMFPDLKTTRFKQITDFYTLITLVAKFEEERLILTDRRRNRLAMDILTLFSNKIDELRLKQKKLEKISDMEEDCRNYLLTVLESTDSLPNRQQRQRILEGLLRSLFEKKDEKRLFSIEQRRLLWNTTNEKKCKITGKKLTWSDFTIDHIHPYSKGGRTALKNAAIVSRSANSRKGNR